MVDSVHKAVQQEAAHTSQAATTGHNIPGTGDHSVIDMVAMGRRARAAAYQLAGLTTEQKNHALSLIADRLEAGRDVIVAANRVDIAQAEAGGTDPLWIRDRINVARRMDGIVADVRNVIGLDDPVGREYDQRQIGELDMLKRRVPLGVIGTIYESRPNVTVDISTLALKTGNAVILRGGSDVLSTNLELVRILGEALGEAGLPADAIQYISNTDRRYVGEMLRLDEYIDMIIPRGGAGLHRFCRENATIPVITGGIGICHLLVDASADTDASLNVIRNAKIQRPAVCNALDTLLVDASIAGTFLPCVVQLLADDGVVFKAEPRARALLDHESVSGAGPDDFDTEWMGLTLGLKVVDSLDEAIRHIRQHSTQHSDGILTENAEHATRFLNEVDSAAVYLNASTRFTDGSAMGLGAEVAISTQKLHARGPMALEELTSYKWIVRGQYTARA